MTNGFLPRSVNIGGRPSFLLNVVNQDLRYQAPHVPVMAFVRLQLLPRWGGDGAGNVTPLFVEQAFGRVTLIEGRELFVAGGKFDSVFGIEYLENSSVFRTGITPSLFARYTTGTALGAQGVLSPADPGAVVGAQPQRRRHERNQLRRGVAADRREPHRRAGRVGAVRIRAEPPARADQAGGERAARARATISSIARR